jgi:hypothetical protein
VIAIRLPWLSEHVGMPAVALADSPLGFDYDDEKHLPTPCMVLRVSVPSARFMAQAPDALPGASCFDDLDEEGQRRSLMDWEQWTDRFLMHAIVVPPMREADVQSLGPDRDLLATSLLRIWSWMGEHTDAACPTPEPAADGIPRCQHFPYLPNKAMQDVLRFLSGRLRIAPHQVLEMPFDGFCLNWRVLKAPRHEPSSLPDMMEMQP